MNFGSENVSQTKIESERPSPFGIAFGCLMSYEEYLRDVTQAWVKCLDGIMEAVAGLPNKPTETDN